ncbi:c-type cytochrome [Vulgatibacter incomptus]|uniref:Cytochrome c domain-containing protein n=1 Tax=Vulgatibacter incomptus TaxID=1391653 RepID=A0A0K1PH07_9BACT|nr:cytochrome c [Vulgatibacter incomptus]AKU92818.1 hypothetical protein AKJ08_3205 [Vulgatibacter incomptus]
MTRSARLVVTSTIASLLILGGVACKGGTETQPSNPKPPAQPAPAPTAPAPKAPAPSEEAPAAPEGGEAPSAVEVTPEAKKEGDELFASLCSTCHGANGDGNGPASASFPTKPANFHSPEFQKSVSNEEIAKAIVDGGPAVGKSPLMPANPNLKDKPAVVEALVQKIRGFGKAE